MQKTKLGISVGLLGAALLLACLFGGYLVAVVLAGYILLFEENAWLRKTAVKGVALMFALSLISSLIGFIPNAINLIDEICALFNGNFYIAFVSNLVTLINTVLVIVEKVLFILLGIKALNQGTIKIPVIDPLVEKYMG